MTRSRHKPCCSRNCRLSSAIAVALVVTLFPVYWIASNSFKFDIDIFAVPPEWFPFNPTLKHYHAAFVERPFLQYALNSLIIAVATTVVSLVLRHAGRLRAGAVPISGSVALPDLASGYSRRA